MVFVMEQCYSGGFAYALAGPGRIFASAAAYNQSSYAIGIPLTIDFFDGRDAFVYYFTCAMGGATYWGDPVQADTDGDGAVSIAEACSYAVTNDTTSDTPQFVDQSKFADIDPMMGANVVSLDGRFGTSFTFENQDVLNFSVTTLLASKLSVFVKDAPGQDDELWTVRLVDWQRSAGTTGNSALNWSSPATALGNGVRTAWIRDSGADISAFPATGFVKFVVSGGSRKAMTVVHRP
jgi:hypothetical protein